MSTQLELVQQLSQAVRTTMSIHQVLGEVKAERIAQIAKWGEQNHPDGTGPDHFIIKSEASGGCSNATLAEAARDRCDRLHRQGRGTWEHILTEELCEAYAEDDPAKLRAELVQVAAVAVAWVEAIDRRAGQ